MIEYNPKDYDKTYYLHNKDSISLNQLLLDIRKTDYVNILITVGPGIYVDSDPVLIGDDSYRRETSFIHGCADKKITIVAERAGSVILEYKVYKEYAYLSIISNRKRSSIILDGFIINYNNMEKDQAIVDNDNFLVSDGYSSGSFIELRNCCYNHYGKDSICNLFYINYSNSIINLKNSTINIVNGISNIGHRNNSNIGINITESIIHNVKKYNGGFFNKYPDGSHTPAIRYENSLITNSGGNLTNAVGSYKLYDDNEIYKNMSLYNKFDQIIVGFMIRLNISILISSNNIYYNLPFLEEIDPLKEDNFDLINKDIDKAYNKINDIILKVFNPQENIYKTNISYPNVIKSINIIS